jgi:hypothetical protein
MAVLNKSTFSIATLAIFLIFNSCKKSTKNVDTSQEFSVKTVCGDCTWIVQNGSKPLINKPKGNYNESFSFKVKAGDTILYLGYNYSVSVNMDGYLMKDGKELRHGVTHCGGNPTFFMEHIVK